MYKCPKDLGLIFFPAFDWMLSPTHPERKERLLYTRDQLTEEGIFDLANIQEYKPRLATLADIQRVHIGPNLDKLLTPAHLVSAGGCLVAADSVLRQEVQRAFALVRPPGHHAMRIVQGIRGFCTINIEAIMIEYLRQTYGIKKVAIVDTDVHHGDGTQDIYYHDPNTLFISFHQDGRTLYPGSGFNNELGSPAAYASTINLPLLPETGDAGIHLLFDELIQPILQDFAPELIINSAGQDNHFTDPLASMHFTAQGYAKLASKLQADIAVLEGGYSVTQALPYINTGIILAMANLDFSCVQEPSQPDYLRSQPVACTKHLEQLIKHTKNIWQNRKQKQQELLAQAQGVFRRDKHIFYDHSNLQEQQEETAFYCDNCSGYLEIISKTRAHSTIVYIINRDTCPKCQQQVHDKLTKAKKQQAYDFYFLQNRQLDQLSTW